MEKQKQQEEKNRRLYQVKLNQMGLNAHVLSSFSEQRLRTIIKLGSVLQRAMAEVFLYVKATGTKHYLYPAPNRYDIALERNTKYVDGAMMNGLLKPEPCRVCLMHRTANPPEGKPYMPDPFYPFNHLWLCTTHLTAMKGLRLKADTEKSKLRIE